MSTENTISEEPYHLVLTLEELRRAAGLPFSLQELSECFKARYGDKVGNSFIRYVEDIGKPIVGVVSRMSFAEAVVEKMGTFNDSQGRITLLDNVLSDMVQVRLRQDQKP